jgi:quinol monooxygenase YgiN
MAQPMMRIRPDKESQMILVSGTVKFAPREMDRLHGEMAAQLEATNAEDGCELYAFARDVLDPDLMHICERWRDDDALKAHFASPHMATFNAVIGTAKLLSMSVKAYEVASVRTLLGE